MDRTKTQKISDYLENLVNKESVVYFQLGAVNACDNVNFFQIGAINLADKLRGVQSSVLANFAHSVKGVQSSLINVSLDRLEGLQLGLFAYAGKGNYLQLALLTVRAGNKPWYKRISPFVGYQVEVL